MSSLEYLKFDMNMRLSENDGGMVMKMDIKRDNTGFAEGLAMVQSL